MKIHYISLEIAVELEDEVNPYDYVHEMFRDHLDVTSFEIQNVESKSL